MMYVETRPYTAVEIALRLYEAKRKMENHHVERVVAMVMVLREQPPERMAAARKLLVAVANEQRARAEALRAAAEEAEALRPKQAATLDELLCVRSPVLPQLLANHRLRMEEIEKSPGRAHVEGVELASLRSFHNAVVELMKGIEP